MVHSDLEPLMQDQTDPMDREWSKQDPMPPTAHSALAQSKLDRLARSDPKGRAP